MRTAALVLLLIGAALGAAWYHGFMPGGLSRPEASVVTAASGDATVPPPPFRISATLISPQQRVVHLQLLDTVRKPYGPSITAIEGETVEGYLVERIDNHRVYFKRDGLWFRIDVGADRIVQDEIPPPATVKQKERAMNFVPPPENIEEIRKEAAIFIEKLKEQPDFKRALEARRRQHLEQQAGTTPERAAP